MKPIFEKTTYNHLILENKLFSPNIINTFTTKNNDKTEETLNKLAIFGLFRTQKPFNSTSIDKLTSVDELNKLYDEWYQNKIKELITVKPFIDNKDLAIKYLNAYVNNIKVLKDKAKPFSIKNIEKEFVDVVLNNSWIEDSSAKVKANIDIYKPESKDVLYEDSELIILNTNTKAKCVMYGKGESWCITKPELNYYNTYRLSYGATIYFVLQKNVEGDEHKLAILNYNGKYSVADKSNSGNRTGSKSDAKSWDSLVKEFPNLEGKEEYFKYVPLTQEEIEYNKLVNDSYDGDDMASYIKEQTKGLVVNGSEITESDFIRDYLAHRNKLTSKQIETLSSETIDNMIEIGYGLGNAISKLNDKQFNRYFKLSLENDSDDFITYKLIERLNDEQMKELLKEKGDDLDEIFNQVNDNSYDKYDKMASLFVKHLELPELVIDEKVRFKVVDMFYVNERLDALSEDTVKEFVENGFFDYDSDYVPDLKEYGRYYINDELFQLVLKDAKEDGTISDDVDITKFDDMIEYIEDTDIHDKLKDAYRRASELEYNKNAGKVIYEKIDDFINDNKDFIKLYINGNLSDTDYLEERLTIYEPNYGFDSSPSAKDVLSEYKEL